MSEIFSSGDDKIVGKEYTFTNSNGEKVVMKPSIYVYDFSNLGNLVNYKLLYDDYYLDQLTLLLKKSYGIPQQISIYTEVLRELNNTGLNLFSILGTETTLDDGSKEWLLNIDKINSWSETKSDLLDKLANIYNVQRTYHLKDYAHDRSGSTYTTITLNNIELYMTIYGCIIRNNFEGTNLQANNLYDKLNQIAKKSDLNDFQINMITNYDSTNECYIFLNADNLYDSDGNVLEQYSNLVNLFYNGYFDIASMGINYKHLNVNYTKVGFFDGIITNVSTSGEITSEEIHPFNYFDEAYWSE